MKPTMIRTRPVARVEKIPYGFAKPQPQKKVTYIKVKQYSETMPGDRT